MKRIIYLLLIIVVCFTASCNRRRPVDNTIRIGYTEFSIDQAIAFVLKGILDQQQNVRVEMYRVADSTMFRAVSTNELDIGISAWYPNTHQRFFDMFPQHVHRHAMIADSLGLYVAVPSYASLDYINDLRNHAEQFRNTILIPDSRNAIYHVGNNILDDYNLDMFTLRESSWDDILSFVEESIANNAYFAFVGMRPHWIFNRFNLKTLNDTNNSFGTHEQAFLIANTQFKERMPSITTFLSRVKFELSDIESIMEMNQVLGSDTYSNAVRWINQNTHRVNRWLIGGGY